MKIIVSIGDANGIGLEVFFKAINLLGSGKGIDFSLACNKQTLSEYVSLISTKLVFPVKVDNKLIIGKEEVEILDICSYSPVLFGKTDELSGKQAGEAIEYAISRTLAKEYDAILTLPISKEAMNLGGYKFTGHTEFLASMCEVDEPLMILCTEKLNTALVTIHEAICDVSQKLSTELLHKRFTQFYSTLSKDYGYGSPRIAVLSLNPHAGENGKIGKEEIELIIPAMQSSEYAENLFGPFPADGFFAFGDYEKYDGVLAMYHDQGLIPLKMIANGGGVNFTAGLPIVRTSPDHGTAFAISGAGTADGKSTLEAILLAEKVHKQRSK